MVSISHLQLVSVPVSDQDRAKNFYVQKLGFTVQADTVMGPQQRWVQLAPPEGPTGITLVTWFPTMPPGSLKGLVLACRDIVQTHADLSARGVEFDGPVQREFWGTFATFDDPDGNGWVLMEQQ